MADGTPELAVRGVSKSFGAVAAVREVSFDLYGGEAHALVGENGAGKSTIVKMLAGVHRLDVGSIELNGVPTELNTPADAKAAGIAVIYQEPTLFPDLSVAENIAMGRQPLGRFKTIDRAEMVRQAGRLFTRLGVSIDPNRPARGLSIADQQLVEIAKALSADARVVVMDEPTAALTGVEVERLFAVARSLRDDGAALLFISHRRQYVKDGTVKKFALWNPADIGYLAAFAGAALSSGQITGAEGEKFKAGKLGEYAVGADGEIVLGPPTEFTAATSTNSTSEGNCESLLLLSPGQARPLGGVRRTPP